MELHHVRRGDGEPLLLIHGLGASTVVWNPVLDPLAEQRDVIAIDLPGFGRSPVPANGYVPSADRLARTVSEFCATLGVERPHVAGNSLGGWVALEMAKTGDAASVCAISPAGMWREPLEPNGAERRDFARRLGSLVGPLVSLPQVRRFVLSRSMAHPERISRLEAAELIRGYLDAPLFGAANDAMRAGVFEHEDAIDVPVTLAWGTDDEIVGRPSRTRRPPGARYLEPDGWGHTPMWDDPDGVAELILEASSPLS